MDEMKKGSEGFEQKRDQIMKSAKSVFGYFGYQKTTLDDIAEKVGIKKNSLYYYFKSKEDLFHEITVLEFNKIISEYERKAAEAESSMEKLKIFLETIILPEYKTSKKDAVSISALLEIDQMVFKSYQSFIDKVESILDEILVEGIKKGEFRKHKTREIGSLILESANAIETAEYFRSNAQFSYEIDYKKIKKKLSNFVDLIITGLHK
ncbi:MAG: TetR/AcrR family transcriptional regulator [Melioribacteraceae bacterium]|nr:TetR/AcrR family transcriptional regulator [Melioribacteraceae bacterium]MCF8394986.1 TetR/AcrR family transcriptional regulator [Melioribacteraceae bacterium]